MVQEIIIDILIICFIIWMFWANSKYTKNKKERRNKLKQDYLNALQSTDKAKALQAGRAYYSDLRYGELTIYDEQAITNDLMTMK